jgi:hypothetical protein
MEESPSWRAYIRVSGQEIIFPLWKQKGHFRVHKSSLLVPFLNWLIVLCKVQGHAIAQAVIRRLPNAAAQVRARGQVAWDLW